MTVESRASWGARPSKGSTFLASTRGVKGHYTGGSVNTGTVSDHSKCRAAVRAIQDFHIDGRGWNDTAYSMVVCEHAAMIARGSHVLPAANGAGLNSGHYAILILVGNSGVTTMTDKMKVHFHEARDWLRSHGSAGTEIKGHRDGYPTDCPGPSVYPWIQAGAPLPNGSSPTPPPTSESEGNDVPQYFSYGRSNTNPVSVPPGEWTKITWDTEYSDPNNEHSGSGYTMLVGDPSLFNAVAFVKFAGLVPGDVVEGRWNEFRYNPGPPATDVLEEAGFASAQLLGTELTASFPEVGSLGENRKLVLEVRHNTVTPGAVTVESARAKIDAWQ